MPITIRTDFDNLPDDAFFEPCEDRQSPKDVRLGLDSHGNVTVYTVPVPNSDRHRQELDRSLRFEWLVVPGILPASAKQMIERLRPQLEIVHEAHSVEDVDVIGNIYPGWGELATEAARTAVDRIGSDIIAMQDLDFVDAMFADEFIDYIDAVGWLEVGPAVDNENGCLKAGTSADELLTEARKRSIHVVGGEPALNTVLTRTLGLNPRRHVVVNDRRGEPWIVVHKDVVEDVIRHGTWPDAITPVAGQGTEIPISEIDRDTLPYFRFSITRKRWVLEDAPVPYLGILTDNHDRDRMPTLRAPVDRKDW